MKHISIKASFASVLLMTGLMHFNVQQVSAMQFELESNTSSVTIMKSSAAAVTLDKESFTKARGRVGEKIEVGTVHISATDLPEGVKFVPSSKINGIFTTDIIELPSGNSETDVTIYYEANKIGKDEGRLYIMSDIDTYGEIKLSGLAIDPNNMPTLTADPMVINDFNTKVSTGEEKVVSVHMTGFPSSVDVKVTQETPGFTVNTSTLYYSVTDHKLKVTFFPKKEGTFEATITLSNEFIDPVEIKVKGKAMDGETESEIEGDELPLIYDNPVTLLNEDFKDVEHNKPLSIEGWKNVAALGQRAWWGYTFPDYDKNNAGEMVAKATAYDSKMEGEEEFQMLLATPPLNMKDASSQMFTFRVMGKYMTEKMTEMLALCYLEYDEEGVLMAYPIEEVVMPCLPDENEKWVDYQVDLSSLDLGDVCHLGFSFMGMRGPNHSTTYFIDDVTFGRTDIPMIKPFVTEVMMNSIDGNYVKSEEVMVETNALTENVNIKLDGKYKDDFTLSRTSLPKEGGMFSLSYESEYKDGYYGVYAVLSSKGAVTKQVAFFATISSGIEAIEISDNDVIDIYSVNGNKLSSVRGIAVTDALADMPTGVYVVRITGVNGTRTLKIRR